MNIPSSFNLFGTVIKVKFNANLVHDRNYCGMASYDKDLIELMPIAEFNPVSESKLERTYCHELAHFLLYYGGDIINAKIGSGYIHQDENCVEVIGNLLHQYFNTQKGTIKGSWKNKL